MPLRVHAGAAGWPDNVLRMGPVRQRASAAAALAVLLAVALLQAGCGSSSGTSEADPASLTPGSAVAYVSVSAKPSGGAHGDAANDLRQLIRQEDPFAYLAQALLRTAGGPLQYKREVQPWIGARAALLFTALPTSGAPSGGQGHSAGGQSSSGSSLLGLLAARLLGAGGAPGSASPGESATGGEEGLPLGEGALAAKGVQGAVVADVSDESRARAFLSTRASTQHARQESYRGVRFWLVPGGLALGMVHGFAVIGSQAAFKGVVDTALGATPLTHAAGYEKPGSGAVANAYLLKPAPGAQSASFVLTAQHSSLTLDGQVREASGAQPLFGVEGARQLAALPGGSWLAAGTGDIRQAAPQAVAFLRGAGASQALSGALASFGGAALSKLLAALSSPSNPHARGGSGLTVLQRLLEPWAGGASIFVSGSGLLEMQAAMVVQSHDPAASRAAVAQLAGIMRRAGAAATATQVPGADAAIIARLPGFPALLCVADGQGAGGHEFVIGLGTASVQGALRPSSTLGGSSSYTSASTTLGQGVKPSVIVEFPALLAMLEALGAAQNPQLAEAVPYLKSLGTLAAGSATSQGASHVRAVLTLAGG